MKILLTGASSFTGLWFAEALAVRGHHITTLLRRSLEDYHGVRMMRVEQLANFSQIVFNCPFGSPQAFEALDEKGPFDLVCHHAAEIADYKSPNFNFAAALASNTLNIRQFFEKLSAQKCQKLLLTGSLFEQREGFSSDSPHAISPYGLSKGLTSDVYHYYSTLYGLKLGKFVIPNPFGPLEEGRFTTYLANSWLQGKTPTVSFPEYVRDNIPVSLLAKSYASFAESLTSQPGFSKLSPSFCPAPQSFFVQQFAQEMQKRLGMPCEFILAKQIEFPEPKVRINCDRLDPATYGWDESSAWDALAKFYLQTFHQVEL